MSQFLSKRKKDVSLLSKISKKPKKLTNKDFVDELDDDDEDTNKNDKNLEDFGDKVVNHDKDVSKNSYEEDEDEENYDDILGDLSDDEDSIDDLSEEEEEEEENNYIYKSKIPNQEDVCFTKKEKDIIIEYIPSSEERFIEKKCDIFKIYRMDESEYHCSLLANYGKGFESITENYPDLFKYIKHDRHDISFDKNSPLVSRINMYPYDIAQDTLRLLKNQEDGTVIFLNTYFVLEKDLKGKKLKSHHVSIDIRRNGKDRDIRIIDLSCWFAKEREILKNTFKGIYIKQDVNININFTFDNFMMNEEKLQTEDDLYTFCKKSKAFLQTAENKLFGFGYCMGWALYFITELYINKRDINDMYKTLYDMDHILRAKYIFVWYDNFFSKLISK
jgi:hypothetical protein